MTALLPAIGPPRKLAPAAERLQVLVADAGTPERGRQGLGVELRIAARARVGTHVDQQLDAGVASVCAASSALAEN